MLKDLFQKNREIILYLVFGVLTTIVSIVLFWISCYPLHLNALLANVISWVGAVWFAFVTNRRWVFEAETEESRYYLRQMITFTGGRLATLGFEELMILIFVVWLHRNSFLVKCFAQAGVVVFNYIISKYLVFKR